ARGDRARAARQARAPPGDPRAPRRRLRRGARRARRDRAGRPRPARRARPPPLRRADRPRARRRDARRLPPRPRRGERRDVGALPPGAPPEGVPRPPPPPPAAAAGDRARGRRGALAAALAGALRRRPPRRGRRGASGARAAGRMILRTRAFRLGATLVVTGVAALYIVSKIDVSRTAHIIGSADPWWLALSLALTVGTVPPQAWRWQLLLRVRGVTESFVWLQRAYFVSYAVGQVLPTSVGGDASRIFETTRRHPGFGSPIARSSSTEPAIGDPKPGWRRCSSARSGAPSRSRSRRSAFC